MQRKLIAGLLTSTLMVGAALPAVAAETPIQVAQTRVAKAQGGEMSDGDVQEMRAILSGVSSIILPGFGQWVFNNQRPKGVMHFIGAVVLWSIPSFVPIPDPLSRLYVAIPTLFHLYSGYDAYKGAGGEMKLVEQPALQSWSFDAQVAAFAQPQSQPLAHLQLASTGLLSE